MIKRFAQSSILRTFLKGSILFYALSGLTSLANYVFYPAVARFLSVREYGEVQFLVSMFGQLAVGFVILNILTIVVSVKLKDDAQREAIRALGIISGIIAAVIAAGGTVVLTVFRQHLGLSSITGVILLGVALVSNIPFTIINGQLQGNGKFVHSGVVSLLSVVIKLVASVIFAVLGYHVAGVVGGICIGLVAAWIIGLGLNGATASRPLLKPSIPTLNFRSLSIIKSYTLVTVITVSALTLLSTADSIVSRIALSPEQAGEYAAVATVTKIILAIATPLMWLALPPAITKDRRSVMRYTMLTAILCGVASIALVVAPRFFTQTLIGIDPKVFLGLVPLAALSMSLYAVAFVTVTSAICFGMIRQLIATSVIALLCFVCAFLLLSKTAQPLPASLLAQIVAALILVIGSISPLIPKSSTRG